jgi:hypothetical protein
LTKFFLPVSPENIDSALEDDDKGPVFVMDEEGNLLVP